MDKKRVLIISYYWPPAGGPGVQRWLKFVKYLPEFNWIPIVYTPENPSYPIVDESLAKDIPSQVQVIKTLIWEPYQLAEIFNKKNKKYKSGQFDIGKKQSLLSKLSIFIRGNFFIPDARIFWVKPSVKFLTQYLKNHTVDVLVTSGPPHSMHLIGLALKKKNPNLKWVADFRDPWTEISYYKHLKLTKRSDKKHRGLEQKVFNTADVVLATSFTDSQNFSEKGANSFCITNGFDQEVKKDNVPTEKFTISYIGVLEQLRNPDNLWQVLSEISGENKEFKENFELKFVGKVDDEILSEISSKNIKSNLRLLGYLPHNLALEEMRKSNILLITNFPDQNSKGIIPGKLFEYLATGKKILSLGPKEADVLKILEDTHAGKHFDFTEKKELKKYILDSYNAWKKGEVISKSMNVDQYSRRSLAKKLITIFSDLLA